MAAGRNVTERYNYFPTRARGAIFYSGRPADDEVFTINGRIYEIDDDDNFPQSSGDVQCDISGSANANADYVIIAAAINGDSSRTVDAVLDQTNGVLHLFAIVKGTAGNAITTTEGLSNATITPTSLSGGMDGGSMEEWVQRYTILTADAGEGRILFNTGFSAVREVSFRIEDAGEVKLDFETDTLVTTSAGNITLTKGSTPAWAAGDVLQIIARGVITARPPA